MRTALLFSILMLWATLTQAQASLAVINPVNNWESARQGTIEQAALTIEPKGIYVDVGLFLTLSAAGAGYFPSDSLEIILDFSLPEEALVHDSWLWVGDTIVKADILDRRTATIIYEGFVNRRQDPSILYKQGAGQYQLRVYPLPANSSRRVKISFLMPADWSAEKVRCELPMEILNASRQPLDSLEIRAWISPEWGQPAIAELPEVAFQWVQTPSLGAFQRASILPSGLKSSLAIELDAPWQQGVYVNRNDSLKIYELVALPEALLSLPEGPGRNLHVLLDYHPDFTNNMTRASLLEGLRDELLAQLTPADTFTVWASRAPTAPPLALMGPMQAEAAAVLAAFASLNPEEAIMADGYLLAAIQGILDAIAAHGSPADVLVISNSQYEGEPNNAGIHVQEFTRHEGFDLANFHIIDYLNSNIYSWWDWWGVVSSWRGNELFYSDLSRLSGGSYLRAGQYRYKLRKALEASDRLRGSIELYTTLASGICYSRFLLDGPGVNVPLRRPLRQVGKYLGDFPLEVSYAAVVEGQLQAAEVAVEAAEAYAIDSLAAKSWAGNYILSLENAAQGGYSIETLVEQSLYHRVLSLHTAFLCLEPSVGGEPCVECIDPTAEPPIVIQTNEQDARPTLEVYVFPNPFAEQLTIVLRYHDIAELSRLRIAVYDSMGRLRALLNAEDASVVNGEILLHWDGRGADGQPLPPGVYVLIVEGQQGRVPVKVVKG
jgi:hypothetical protein